MGIRTKLCPMGGGGGKKKYKAYIASFGRFIDVSTLGFTEEIDPDKTFCSNDLFPNDSNYDKYNSNLVVLNGKLYVFDGGYTTASLIRIGSLSNWTYITGICLSDDPTDEIGYGIAGGKLYRINNASSTTLIDDLYTWLSISGFKPNSGFRYYCNFGIVLDNSTKRCARVNNSNSSLIISVDEFHPGTSVVVGQFGEKTNGGGIYVGYMLVDNGGFLYLISDSNISLVTSNCNSISCGSKLYSSSKPLCSFIVNGENTLYGVCGGSLSSNYVAGKWTKISGWASPTTSSHGEQYALGIDDGVLNFLALSRADTSSFRISTYKYTDYSVPVTGWTDVCGSLFNATFFDRPALGIRNGNLYKIFGFNPETGGLIEETDLTRCVKIYGQDNYDYGIGLVICEN